MRFVGSCFALLNGIGVMTGEHITFIDYCTTLILWQREGWHSRQNVRLYCVGKLVAALPVRRLQGQRGQP
jgi:hypothetical protein